MKNSILSGGVVTLTAPYNRSAGQGMLVGSLFGVAVTDVLSGAEVVVELEGAFTLAKATGAWTQGAKLYWDDSAKNVTTTPTSNTYIGYALAAAGSGDATGPVLLAIGV